MDDNYWQLCSTEDTNSGQGQTANGIGVKGAQQQYNQQQQVTLPSFQQSFGRNIKGQVSQIVDAGRGSPACWPTESLAGWPTESPAGWPTESPAGWPTESPAGWPTQSPAGWPAESPAGWPTESPAGWPTESPAGWPAESPAGWPTESPAGWPAESPAGWPAESPAGWPAESPAGWPAESPAGWPAESPAGWPAESPAGWPAESPAGWPAESPAGWKAESPAGWPAESPAGWPAESPAGLPTESPACLPTESPACLPTESPACLPTESPACLPTESPACLPTESPACLPTESPACLPTESPACLPTESPACLPTESPACLPTESPACLPTESPACLPTESPACLPTESPACLSTEAPTGVQIVAGLRHENIFQLEELSVSGLQGVQVQGDHTPQIISNAQILQSHGTYPNLIAAGAVSSTPNYQHIEGVIPNQTVNAGTEIRSHQMQRLPDDPNKWHNVATVTNPATMRAPNKHSQVNEYAFPNYCIIVIYTPITATATTSKLSKSQTSNSELNAPRRRPSCINPDKRNSGSRVKHICHFYGCTKEFKYPSGLKAHIRSHTGEKPFVCTWVSCGKMFERSKHLQRHRRTHTAHQLQKLPDVPNKWHNVATATNPATMSAPNKHSQVNEYVIPNIAISATATTAKLTKSQASNELNAPRRMQRYAPCTCPNCINPDKSESREKHICDFPGCTKVYKYASKLQDHILSHTDEKPFVCTWVSCGKRYRRSYELQRHERTHTDEKRYQCTECIKRFMRRNNLSQHLERHNKRTLQVPT